METIDPERVRFTQSSVRATFRDGQTIEELARGLQEGTVSPADVPPLRLFERDGHWFTLDNRRRLAFRLADCPAPCRLASPEEVEEESWKFTTTNEGTSIRVR